MKIYPEGLEKLLKENSKKSIINYPLSFLKIMLRFQIAHQIVKGGHKLTYEDIALIMMMRGVKEIITDIEDMKEMFSKDQAANFKLRYKEKSKKLITSKN